MPNTITLKDEGRAFRKEAEASAAITPGHLVEFGGANELQAHSTVGGPARRAFALENDLIGKGPTDAYAAGDIVQYGVFPPGAEVWALAAEAVTLGDFLESAGDGQLQVSSTPVAASVVGVAMETIGAPGRVKIEVM